MVITLTNLVSPIYAHADYDRSEPASGTVIREAPTRIHVWFTQELFHRAGANNLSVENSDGGGDIRPSANPSRYRAIANEHLHHPLQPYRTK